MLRSRFELNIFFFFVRGILGGFKYHWLLHQAAIREIYFFKFFLKFGKGPFKFVYLCLTCSGDIVCKILSLNYTAFRQKRFFSLTRTYSCCGVCFCTKSTQLSKTIFQEIKFQNLGNCSAFAVCHIGFLGVILIFWEMVKTVQALRFSFGNLGNCSIILT